jgi:iron complex transport system substrate-binding protein
MRIISLLPSATEMVYALGLGNALVGVTHECDFPEATKSLHTVVRPAINLEGLSQVEIDAKVSARLREGKTLYEIDEKLLLELAPDIILTQDLCQVCAPSGNQLSHVVMALTKKPKLIWMTPRNLAGVKENILELSQAAGVEARAAQLFVNWDQRISAVRARSHLLAKRPRTVCVEWINPLFCAGHWIPEMMRLAGGDEGLGREGEESIRIDWQRVRDFKPERIFIMSCGYPLQKAIEQADIIKRYEGLNDLPAVQSGEVYVVDSNAFFARPGPRLVDGTELLSHLLTGAPWFGPKAYTKLEL